MSQHHQTRLVELELRICPAYAALAVSATRKISGFYGKIKCGLHFTTTFPFFSGKILHRAWPKIAFLHAFPWDLFKAFPRIQTPDASLRWGIKGSRFGNATSTNCPSRSHPGGAAKQGNMCAWLCITGCHSGLRPQPLPLTFKWQCSPLRCIFRFRSSLDVLNVTCW